MIGTIKIQINAAHPNLALPPMYAFVGSPSNLRILDVPKKIGNWQITEVQVNFNYPDNTQQTLPCVLIGGAYVCTLPASNEVGKSVFGYTVLANGVDENRNVVSGYVLGKGDIVILDSQSMTVVGGKSIYVNLLSAQPTSPNDGDIWQVEDGGYVVQQDGEAHNLGTPFNVISAYVDSQISGKANVSAINMISAYVDSQVSSKADAAYVDSQVSSKADISATVLSDVYDYSDQWNFSPDTYEGEKLRLKYVGEVYGKGTWTLYGYASGSAFGAKSGKPNDTLIVFEGDRDWAGDVDLTAIRVANRLYGYKLGDQSSKVLASANDVVLSTLTKATSTWTFSPISTYNDYPLVLQYENGGWALYYDDGGNLRQIGSKGGSADATTLVFEAGGDWNGDVDLTATRLIPAGYVLGSYSAKPLQPMGDYQMLSNMVSVLLPTSTNEQYPTAKCVYDLIEGLRRYVENRLSNVQ